MVYEVKPDVLIERLTEELKEREAVEPPEWAEHVKTGVSKERAPESPDWWYRRAASVLRYLYVEGPLGVRRLSAKYGGKYERGSSRSHFRRGSRKIQREVLQQLEEEGLVAEVEGEGRSPSREGESLLNRLSTELRGEALEA